jgi:hypothetical protein
MRFLQQGQNALTRIYYNFFYLRRLARQSAFEWGTSHSSPFFLDPKTTQQHPHQAHIVYDKSAAFLVKS